MPERTQVGRTAVGYGEAKVFKSIWLENAQPGTDSAASLEGGSSYSLGGPMVIEPQFPLGIIRTRDNLSRIFPE